MDENREEFIAQLKSSIKSRKTAENGYKILRVVLMIAITVCGFLTSTASHAAADRSGLFVSPDALFIFGLTSAICAVLNQNLSPSEKALFHKNVKKALQQILLAVEYDHEIEIAEAARLQSIAIVNPDALIAQLTKTQLNLQQLAAA